MSNLSQFFPSASGGSDPIESIAEFSSLSPVLVKDGKNYVSLKGVLADKNLFDPTVDFSNSFQSIYGNNTDPSVLTSKFNASDYDFAKVKTSVSSKNVSSKGWYINGMYYLYSGQNQTITRSSDLLYWQPINLPGCFDIGYDSGKWFVLNYNNVAGAFGGNVQYCEYDDIFASPTFKTELPISSGASISIPACFSVLNGVPYLLTLDGNLFKITPGTGALTKVLTTGLTIYNQTLSGTCSGMVYCPTGTSKYFMFFNTVSASGAASTSSKVYSSQDGITWALVTLATNGDFFVSIRAINGGAGYQVIATICNGTSFVAGASHGFFVLSTAAIPVVTKYWYTSAAPGAYLTDIFHDGTRYVAISHSSVGTQSVACTYSVATSLTAVPTSAGVNDNVTSGSYIQVANNSTVFYLNGQYFSDGLILYAPGTAPQVWRKSTSITAGSFTAITLTGWFIRGCVHELTISGTPGIAMVSVGGYSTTPVQAIMCFLETSGANSYLTTGRFKLISITPINSITFWNGYTAAVGNGIDKLVIYQSATSCYANSGCAVIYWTGTTLAPSTQNLVSPGGSQDVYALTFACWNNSFYAFPGDFNASTYSYVYYSDNGGLTWSNAGTVATPASVTATSRLLITQNAIIYLMVTYSSGYYSINYSIMRLLNGTFILNPPVISYLHYQNSVEGMFYSWVNLPYIVSAITKQVVKINVDGSMAQSILPATFTTTYNMKSNVGVGYNNLGSVGKYIIDFTDFANITLTDKGYTGTLNQYALLQETMPRTETFTSYSSNGSSDTQYEFPQVNGNVLTITQPRGGVIRKFDLSKAIVETHRYYKQSDASAANQYKFIRVA